MSQKPFNHRDPRIEQAVVQSHHIAAMKNQMNEQMRMQEMIWIRQFMCETARELFVREMQTDLSDPAFVRQVAECCNRQAMELGKALGMIQEIPQQEEGK